MLHSRVGWLRRRSALSDGHFGGSRICRQFLHRPSAYSYTRFRDQRVAPASPSRYCRDELHSETRYAHQSHHRRGVMRIRRCRLQRRVEHRQSDGRRGHNRRRAQHGVCALDRPPDTLPAAVPVPPASTSPVVTGAIEEPAASETPVDYAKLAASTIDPTVQVTTRSPAEPSATQSTPSSGPAETKSGTDSPETPRCQRSVQRSNRNRCRWRATATIIRRHRSSRERRTDRAPAGADPIINAEPCRETGGVDHASHNCRSGARGRVWGPEALARSPVRSDRACRAQPHRDVGKRRRRAFCELARVRTLSSATIEPG